MRSVLDAPKTFLRNVPAWWWLLAALALGTTFGAGVALLRGSGTRAAAPAISTLPAHATATWAEGKQPAPGFRLREASGAPISLAEFRGKPVIVTFIDPACTTLCPLEAKELDSAEAALPASRRPEIIAVSVNPWGDTRANFRHDARKWRLVPQWRWAVGPRAQLAAVWKRYKIGVLDRKVTAGGITVHNIAHTEASFIVGPAGYERALFLFPFVGADVDHALRRLASGA
jgi:protein SCO1/2